MKPPATATGLHRIDRGAVPGSALLENWSRFGWHEGVQIDRLRDLDILEVRTRNTLYRLTVIKAETAEVLITGGRFFAEPTRGVVLGCSLGGAFLKLRGVYPGFSLELFAGGVRIVTSPVHAIQAVADPELGPIQ